MPFYSKMAGSYPFQLIRGLGSGVINSPTARRLALGAGIGAGIGLSDNRRSLPDRIMRGAAIGALGTGIAMNAGAIGTLAGNMYRSGAARSAMMGAVSHRANVYGRFARMKAGSFLR